VSTAMPQSSSRTREVSTPRWSEMAHSFASALRRPDLPVPSLIGKTDDAPAVKRFNVYRNNVAMGLQAALAATFPVVKALVGEEFFAVMAQIYVANHLPSSPVLLDYGSNFPDFIKTFEPTRQLPYLPDVARIEWSFNESYHAADATPITIKVLSALNTDVFERTRIVLHPSLRLICSDWPVLSIWHAHQQDDPATHLPDLAQTGGEYGFLVRPKLEVQAMLLPAAGFKLLAALCDGETLTAAAGTLPEAVQGDLSAMLAMIFSAGAVVDLTTDGGKFSSC